MHLPADNELMSQNPTRERQEPFYPTNGRQHYCYLNSIGLMGDVVRVFDCYISRHMFHIAPRYNIELWNITIMNKFTTKFQQLQKTIWKQIKAPPNR